MNRLEFGEWLAETRKAKGLTYRAMAKDMGYSAAYLSDVEKAKVGVSFEFCAKLSSYLGVDEHQIRRYAGLEGNSIPDKPLNPATAEFDDLISNLPQKRQDEILEVVRLLAEQRATEEKAQRGKKIARASPKPQRATV